MAPRSSYLVPREPSSASAKTRPNSPKAIAWFARLARGARWI